MHAMNHKPWDGTEQREEREPALLLLPGWDSDPDRIESLRQQLVRRFRLLSPVGVETSRSPTRAGELIEASSSAIELSGASQVIVAAVGHAGWTAIALRRQIGERIRGLVLLEWRLLVESWPLREGSPLAALTRLDPPVPVLHLYAQPRTPDFLVVQQGFARSHRWFQVELLESSHRTPALERPHAIAHAIDRFASAGP